MDTLTLASIVLTILLQPLLPLLYAGTADAKPAICSARTRAVGEG